MNSARSDNPGGDPSSSPVPGPRPKPLRFADPACHRLLLEQLAPYHLHAHDVHAVLQIDEAEAKATMTLSYGDAPVRRIGEFSAEALKRQDTEIVDFFREAAKDCKKTLVADYYKLMKV